MYWRLANKRGDALKFEMWLSGILFGAVLSHGVMAQDLFKYSGKTYSNKDLPEKFQQQLYEAQHNLYHMQERIIEEAAIDIYFHEKAKKAGKSPEALRKEELSVGEPTEQQLKDFYGKNRDRIPYPYEQVKGELVRIVKDQDVKEKQQIILAKVKKKGGLDFLIKKPVPPKFELNVEGFPEKGAQNAKVTIVEFADYKCPHCKKAFEAITAVLPKFKNKVRLIFVDFPIIGDSYKISEGAHCAGKQDKFWEYHEMAFEKQGELTTAEAIAEKVKGIDQAKFKDCVSKREPQALVEKGKAEGERLGVSGTPVVFVNGYRISGHADEETVTQAINDALNGKLGAS